MISIRRSILVLISFIACSAIAQPQAQRKYSTMTAAMTALTGAKSADEKQAVYSEIGQLPLENPAQLLSLYDELVSMEGRVQESNPREYVDTTRYLSRVFYTAKDPKFSDALVSVLNKEYGSMPKNFIGPHGATNVSEASRYEMRAIRFEALADVIGQTRNRAALPTLRKMLQGDGVVRVAAVGAIGNISDSSDIQDFIRRIKSGTETNISMDSFGPAAVEPIMRAVDDPATSDKARAILASALRYMGSRDNLSTFRSLLHHKNYEVQEMAAEAICRTAGAGDTDAIIEVANSAAGRNRLLAVRAMNKNWDGRFIPVLRNILLYDGSPIVRAEVARTFAAHRIVEAVPDLKKCLNDREGEVRRAADAALKKLQ